MGNSQKALTLPVRPQLDHHATLGRPRGWAQAMVTETVKEFGLLQGSHTSGWIIWMPLATDDGLEQMLELWHF